MSKQQLILRSVFSISKHPLVQRECDGTIVEPLQSYCSLSIGFEYVVSFCIHIELGHVSLVNPQNVKELLDNVSRTTSFSS